MKTAKERKMLKQQALKAFQMKIRNEYEGYLAEGYGRTDAKNLCAEKHNLSFCTINNYIRLTQEGKE